MRLSTASLLAAASSSLFSLAVADVQFTTPSPGASVPGSASISVAWGEGTGTTTLSEFTTYQLFLFAGGETESAAVRRIYFANKIDYLQFNLATGRNYGKRRPYHRGKNGHLPYHCGCRPPRNKCIVSWIQSGVDDQN